MTGAKENKVIKEVFYGGTDLMVCSWCLLKPEWSCFYCRDLATTIENLVRRWKYVTSVYVNINYEI